MCFFKEDTECNNFDEKAGVQLDEDENLSKAAVKSVVDEQKTLTRMAKYAGWKQRQYDHITATAISPNFAPQVTRGTITHRCRNSTHLLQTFQREMDVAG